MNSNYLREANRWMYDSYEDYITEKELSGQDEVKEILKDDYPKFVKILGDNINDKKFIGAIKILAKEKPVKTKDMDVNVLKLIPTQNEIDFDKSLMFPLTNKQNSAELCFSKSPIIINGNPIVTAGNGKYIIDGHHRWSQVFLVNPSAKMEALDLSDISNPNDALKATQLSIVADSGKLPTAKGGGFNLFEISEKVFKQKVKALISDDAIEIFSKNDKGDDKEKIADYLWQNVLLMRKSNNPIKNATNREIMPQTDQAPGWKHELPNISKV
ncbi:MAG TPA: hypothetical protein DCS19_04920 [Flavobacterium sp.]|nr:hypothetical protein [Flavobacterium sp.]